MRSLTVVTYNIQHGRGMDQHLDLRRTARVLQELSPDIVALQEVDCFRRSSRFRCQARFLARSLGCYYAYGPVNHYFPGSYGNAVLSRYPIRWKRNHVIQDDEKRCCLEVEINSGESCWRVLNLHLGLKAPQRYQQVQDIVIPLCGAVSGPLILAGDFNSIPTSRVIKLVSSCLQDSFAANSGECIYTFNSRNPLHRIDYIFTNQACQIHDYRIIDTAKASDHLPVVARIGAAQNF